MRGHLSSRMKALSSWSVAGALTLVLSTTAMALMLHVPADHTPLSEPVASHSSPTTSAPSAAPPTTGVAPPVTTPLTVPTTVTYTYSYAGDDTSESSATAPTGAYGDD